MNGRTQKRRKRSRAGRRKERKEREEEEEEDSLYAPISTTGILGLIIQMWMLLLENTRSRVDALSPAQERRLKSATAEREADRHVLRGCGTDIVWFLIKCPGRGAGGGVLWERGLFCSVRKLFK